jgi:hypothetical protein
MEYISGASNLKTGTNPSYTVDDFYAIYPQFGKNSSGEYVIFQDIVQMYLDLANACINKERWRTGWKVGMGLFIAHFCTLYVQSLSSADDGIDGITKAGQPLGLQTSISVGDVSASTDYSITMSDVSGYANWKSTKYGQQIIQLARLYGKGGMLIN